MSGWSFVALGVPAPQGSHRGFVNPKTGGVIITNNNKNTKPWRQTVVAAAPPGPKLDGPIALYCVFTLPRPKSARKIDVTPCKKPDLDKLLRNALDSLTDAGLVADDARIVEVARCAKVWTGYDFCALETPGVLLAAVEISSGGYRAELRDLRDKALTEHRAAWNQTG